MILTTGGNYHVVNQILSRGLHSADDECKEYTVNLMDKLETAKAQDPPVDAIVDDIAAKAYVEQFALETFQKGDTAIHTDNASRSVVSGVLVSASPADFPNSQTIDTFQAASTFLELLSTWGPLDPEFSAKIKYAKYHALRIAKALKAGENPNASNPKDDLPAEDDPLAAASGPVGDTVVSPAAPTVYQPPNVRDETLSPATGNAVSVSSASQPPAGQSSNGEYFPPAPTFTSEPSIATTKTASPDTAMPDTLADSTAYAPPSDPSAHLQTPQDFYTQQPVSSLGSPQPAVVPPTSLAPPPMSPQPPHTTAVSAGGSYRTDDESVALAQKHAKWAISALNFEDVNTAVKELRLALNSLGAS